MSVFLGKQPNGDSLLHITSTTVDSPEDMMNYSYGSTIFRSDLNMLTLDTVYECTTVETIYAGNYGETIMYRITIPEWLKAKMQTRVYNITTELKCTINTSLAPAGRIFMCPTDVPITQYYNTLGCTSVKKGSANIYNSGLYYSFFSSSESTQAIIDNAGYQGSYEPNDTVVLGHTWFGTGTSSFSAIAQQDSSRAVHVYTGEPEYVSTHHIKFKIHIFNITSNEPVEIVNPDSRGEIYMSSDRFTLGDLDVSSIPYVAKHSNVLLRPRNSNNLTSAMSAANMDQEVIDIVDSALTKSNVSTLTLLGAGRNDLLVFGDQEHCLEINHSTGERSIVSNYGQPYSTYPEYDLAYPTRHIKNADILELVNTEGVNEDFTYEFLLSSDAILKKYTSFTSYICNKDINHNGVVISSPEGSSLTVPSYVSEAYSNTVYEGHSAFTLSDTRYIWDYSYVLDTIPLTIQGITEDQISSSLCVFSIRDATGASLAKNTASIVEGNDYTLYYEDSSITLQTKIVVRIVGSIAYVLRTVQGSWIGSMFDVETLPSPPNFSEYSLSYRFL
jgi:hypothetical protein